jgi:hypothetical protein
MLLTFYANGNNENQKSTNNFVPVRYIRNIFFFLSGDTSAALFADVIKKFIELDNYCSGENFNTSLVFGKGSLFSACMMITFENCFYDGNEDNSNRVLERYLNASIAKNISAGSIDSEDVNNVSTTLLKFATDIFWTNKYYPARFTFQIILVTNYLTESLRSKNTTLALAALAEKNVTFIALTANISNDRAKEYFKNNIWTIVNTNYTKWTPENETTDPICINQHISEFVSSYAS